MGKRNRIARDCPKTERPARGDQQHTRCPHCREPVAKDDLVEALRLPKGPGAESALESTLEPAPDAAPDGLAAAAAVATAGAKIEHLLAYVGKLEPTDKLVIFSSFTKFLDLAKARERVVEQKRLWGIVLLSSTRLHVRPTGVHRTCR